MINIKQLIIKITLSFLVLTLLFGCQTILEQNSTQQVNSKIEIAILMPLSGPQAAISKEYINLMKLGLMEAVYTETNVTVYDGATELLALQAMQKIIARNTKIILGPLTSPVTKAIASSAKTAGIIVLSMSNNPVLADDKLFVFGHAPLKQLKTVMDYLLANNYTHFVTLLPAGHHSQNINRIIQNAVVSKHATLMRSEFYDHTPESISNAVSIINAAVDNINEVDDENLSKPVIYLGDDATMLTLIYNSLSLNNLDKKALLAGDNRLDFYYPRNLDMIFTGSLNLLNSNVRTQAEQVGISYITFMHALAYDLGKITTTSIGNGYNEQRFINRLNSKTLYPGISGNIYFIDNIAQREYDILTKAQGKLSTLSSGTKTINY